jgi:hypothetical protein
MMALPGNVTTVVVLGTFLTPEGNPSTGTITFTPSRWLNNSGANVAVPNSSVTKTLGTAGNFSAVLPVTDDGDLSPANWYYTVSEVVDGVSQAYDILLPGSVATGGTVYLADIAPAAALGPEFASTQGPAGSAATITVGTVTAGTAGGTPTVTNSGSTSAAILNFVLIPGNTGPTGATGPIGPQGSAATIAVGTVSSVPNGGTAAVTNSGTSGSATFDFVLRDGPTGSTGPQGSAATITVGTVTTVPFGGTAAVTNTGTSGSAVLDFVLVTGPQGSIGALSATAPLDYTSNTFSLRYGAGLGTATGGTLVADLSDATPAALGAAGSAGTATKIARADHAHIRPTAGEVGAVGTATTITAGTALAGGGDLSTSRTLNVTLSDATPAAVGTPAAGTATSPSRADHVHEGTTLSSATPVALGTATAGTATTAARGDHRHAMPSASDVGAVANSLVTAKGDLIVRDASAPARLAVGGTNGHVLKVNSATSTGLEWGSVATSGEDDQIVLAVQVFG